MSTLHATPYTLASSQLYNNRHTLLVHLILIPNCIHLLSALHSEVLNENEYD
jgi:hypothetical protein